MVVAADWEVVRLGDFADVRTGPFGSALHASDYVPSGTPIITVEHLGRFRLEGDDAPMVTDKDRDRLSKYILRDGDIVFSRVGSIGRFGLVTEVEEGWLFSGRLLRVRLEHGYAPFVYHQMCTTGFIRQIESVAVGQTMPSLNTVIVNDLRVLLPPLREQKAIAEVLSNADASIESLDALIAKKRDMKQAAMQQLLTGRTRLPGFTAEWQMTLLGEVLDFEVGFPFDSGQFHPYEGIRLVRNADLKSDIAVVCIRGSYPANYLVADGDLLIGMDGDFVPVLWKRGEALLNQRVGRVRTSSKSDTTYMSFALLKPLKGIEHMTSATTVKHLSHSDVVGIRVPLPSVAEQKAIAEVLSDMDAEIDALVAQREKAELVKQGMMQELLSGRVRLT